MGSSSANISLSKVHQPRVEQMGSFEGHLVPGIFFVTYGAWWCFNSIWFHLKRKKTRINTTTLDDEDEQLSNTSHSSFFEYKQDSSLSKKSWIPAFFYPRFPFEPIIKVILSAIGIFVEAFLNYDENHHLYAFVYHVRTKDNHLNDLGKLYHITLYSSFLLSGIVDLLSICFKFPSPTSTLFLGLSFLTEGFLFHYHIQGRDSFDIAVHMPLLYIISACFVFTLLRLYSQSNLLINLSLGMCILFQGTWFIQIGYFLFGGFLHEDEAPTDKHIMIVSAYFSWHLLFLSVGNLVLFGLLTIVLKGRHHILRKGWKKMKKKKKRDCEYQMKRKSLSEEHVKLLSNGNCDGVWEEKIEMHQMNESHT